LAVLALGLATIYLALAGTERSEPKEQEGSDEVGAR
jgi:hypothetical protein